MRLRAAPKVEQQTELRYDLVDGLVASSADMTGDHDHTRRANKICVLIGRFLY